MDSLIDNNEIQQIAEIANNPESQFSLQAKLLLLIQEGFSVRQVAVRIGLSPSGVHYWVKRYRRLGLNALLPSDVNTQKPNLGDEKRKKLRTKSNKKKKLEEFDKLTSIKQPTRNKENQINFDREYSLPENLQSPGIQPHDLMAVAGKKTLMFHFIQMLKNEDETIKGKDIEALHDMRVATRRMRAAFEVFQSEYNPKSIKPIMKGLRQTGRSLGEVRDLDVFMEKIEKYLDVLPKEKRSGLDPLLKIWQDQRTTQREKMISYLQGPQYKKFLTDFSEFLKIENFGLSNHEDSSKNKRKVKQVPLPNQVQFTVPLLIYTRLAYVNAYESKLNNANIADLHALRIELKRLRYTLEFFSEVLGSELSRVIKEIKGLQDHLGDLNDADVACNMLSEILKNWENIHNDASILDRPNPEPLIAYLAFRADERHQLLISFPKVWEKFKNSDIRKELAIAISVL